MLEAYVTILLTISISLIVVNIFAIKLILRVRDVRKPTRLVLMSLLTAHLLQGLVVAPTFAVERTSLHRAKGLCEIFQFSFSFTNYICTLSVLIITVERYLGVRFPFRLKEWITQQRMRTTLSILWVYMFLLCLIPFVKQVNSHCSYTPQKEWILAMDLMHTLLPLIIICFCYIGIFKIMVFSVKTHKQRNCHQTTGRDWRRSYRRRKKRCKMTLIIVGMYLVTWLPCLIYDLLLTICTLDCFPNGYFKPYTYYDGSLKMEIVGFVFRMFTLLDGLISPLVYCSTHVHYYTMFVKIRRSLSTIRLRAKSTDVHPLSKALRESILASRLVCERSAYMSFTNMSNIKETCV